MQRLFLLLIIYLTLLYSISATRHEPRILGGWQKIGDITDPYLIEIAEFAITEHDKQAHAKLKLEKLLGGEYQVVAGVNYKIRIEALDGKVKGQYAAFVYDRPWEKIRVLNEFNKV